MLPVTVVRLDSDQGIVGSATTKRTNTRVEYTEGLCACRRVGTGVTGAIGQLVSELGVLLHLLLVVEVLDKVVPPHGLILGGNRVQCGHIVLGGVGLVVTCLEDKDLVPGHGEPGSKGSTAGTRADDNILIVFQRSCSGSTVGGTLEIYAAKWGVLGAIAVGHISILLSTGLLPDISKPRLCVG
jgi:hypothetical protein